MKKKIILGLSIALVIIIALLIVDRFGLVTKKMSRVASLTEENATLVDQNEYVLLDNDQIMQIGKESVSCFSVSSSYQRKELWQEISYTKYPLVSQNGNLVCVFDKQGYNGIVYNEKGKLYELKVNLPILKVALNKNGYSAVLQKSNTDSESKSVITLFDNEGKKLLDRISYEENGGVPLAVSISDSNDTFCTSYLDVSNNNILSKVIFFKIDGKELKDNLFSSFEFAGSIVTDLKYLDAENIIAIADDKLIRMNLFTEKCDEKIIEDRISYANLSFDNSIVLVCDKNTSQFSGDAKYVEFYSNNLKKKKEQVIYNTVSQVCANKKFISCGNGNEYNIYSSNGIAKCKTSFNVDVKKILMSNRSNTVYVATSKGLDVYKMQNASFMSN
ncbi:MAG: DUF5711 family protein [Clostridia bacterium]|nr:DUF5711 family protein [Clostridia bacterium]